MRNKPIKHISRHNALPTDSEFRVGDKISIYAKVLGVPTLVDGVVVDRPPCPNPSWYMLNIRTHRIGIVCADAEEVL